MGDDSKKYTDRLDALLERKIKNILMDVHVALPGKICSYDYATQKADVKPTIKRRLRDGTSQTIPVIANVPVVFPRFDGGYVYYPVKVDDNVLLIFSDYSLDNWAFNSEQDIDCEDVRTHNITDAFALAGAYGFNNPISGLANDDDFIIKVDKFTITIKPDGKISIKNTDENVDLVTEAYNLAAAGEAATVTTALGVMPLNNKATWTAIKTALAKIKI